jgi:hypothetical protein
MSAYPMYEIWLSRDHARYLPVTLPRSVERVRLVGEPGGDVHLECYRDGQWEPRPAGVAPAMPVPRPRWSLHLGR